MTKQQHIEYGRHSGIPECCIMFFVGEWDREIITGWDETPYARAIHKCGFGYVPCPECLGTHNKVKIIDCVREHGRDCRFDYQTTEKEFIKALDNSRYIC